MNILSPDVIESQKAFFQELEVKAKSTKLQNFLPLVFWNQYDHAFSN